jgi:hypothetical protein
MEYHAQRVPLAGAGRLTLSRMATCTPDSLRPVTDTVSCELGHCREDKDIRISRISSRF